MIGYLVRRLVWSVFVIWFVVSTTFAMLMWIPAEPARTLVGPHATPETLARVRQAYCLDAGFVETYGCFVGRMVRGDMGESFRTGRDVAGIIADKIWPTVQLALAAMFLQLAMAIPLGLIAATRRNRLADYLASGTAAIGQSAPTFFVGLLLMYLCGYRLGWFPISGYGEGFWDRLHHLILPGLTLAVVGAAYYTRLLRSEMIEVLTTDYVRTARAKGLSERMVVTKHGLRTGLGPVVTFIGLDLGVLMGGAVVTESIFAWPGLGREVLSAVLNIDIPLILGVVTVTSLAIVGANLVTDLAYAWLDPRVRLSA
ncbi:MAG: ABC transporter permease [Proteobacteria bacterium]|nr:ABC transporter permease [Pseudomonadota bacterium]